MADKPIIFSTPMVQALLNGRKTQTRRLIKPQPYTVESVVFTWEGPKSSFLCGPEAVISNLRDHGAVRYAPGDRLYVREAWRAPLHADDVPPREIDRLTGIQFAADGMPLGPFGRLRASIHMPRSASRLTLAVTEVRVQRLQEISEADAMAEGGICEAYERQVGEGYGDCWSYSHGQEKGADSARESFRDLWNSLHPSIIRRSSGTSKANPGAWDENPWVAAISFTVQHGNIDAVAHA